MLPIARQRPLPARHLRVSSRWFHITSRALQTNSDGPAKAVDASSDSATKNIDIHEDSRPGESEDPATTGRDGESGESTFKPEASTEELATGGGAEGPADRPQRARGRPAGSKSRRVVTKTMPQIPKPDVPQWFLDHGVTLREDFIMDPAGRRIGIAPVKPTCCIVTEPQKTPSDEKAVATPEDKSTSEEAPKEEVSDNAINQLVVNLEEEKKHRYWLDEPVWNEIQTHVQAGLMLPKTPFLNSFAAMKSNCLLHFPKEGGIYCLDAVVESVAADVGADLVRIDVQDLEEIAGDFLGDSRQCRCRLCSKSASSTMGANGCSIFRRVLIFLDPLLRVRCSTYLFPLERDGGAGRK